LTVARPWCFGAGHSSGYAVDAHLAGI
jgi:hypothetical protein